MYESYLTVVGNVVTNPVKRITPNGDEVTNFRVASNQRRMDRETKEWVDGGTLFVAVSCWRKAAAGAGAAFAKGDPVIVYGTVKTTEYTTKEGAPRNDLELTASAVGPDLARCFARMDRTRAATPAPIEPDTTQTYSDADAGSESELRDESVLPSAALA